jgi:cell division septal protein FtsQ
MIKAYLFIFIVFCLGAIVGGVVVYYLAMKRAPENPVSYISLRFKG